MFCNLPPPKTFAKPRIRVIPAMAQIAAIISRPRGNSRRPRCVAFVFDILPASESNSERRVHQKNLRQKLPGKKSRRPHPKRCEGELLPKGSKLRDRFGKIRTRGRLRWWEDLEGKPFPRSSFHPCMERGSMKYRTLRRSAESSLTPKEKSRYSLDTIALNIMSQKSMKKHCLLGRMRDLRQKTVGLQARRRVCLPKQTWFTQSTDSIPGRIGVIKINDLPSGIPPIPLFDLGYFGLQRTLFTGIIKHLLGFFQIMSQKVLVRRSYGVTEVVMKLVLLYWLLHLLFHIIQYNLNSFFFQSNRTSLESLFAEEQKGKYEMTHGILFFLPQIRKGSDASRFFEGQYKHAYIGRVIAENQSCLILLGRSFHFRKISSSGAIAGERLSEANGLHTEPVSERAIPWASIEFAQIIEGE